MGLKRVVATTGKCWEPPFLIDQFLQIARCAQPSLEAQADGTCLVHNNSVVMAG